MLDRRVFLLAAGPFLVTGEAAYGRDDDDDNRGRTKTSEDLQRALQERKILPLSEILAEQQSRLGGSVIEAELKRERGGYVYKLKVLTSDGRVSRVRVDATSGKDAQK